MGTIVKSGKACHMSLNGVMANSGFGRLCVRIGKYTMMLPENALRKDGTLKKAYYRQIAELRLAAAKAAA